MVQAICFLSGSFAARALYPSVPLRPGGKVLEYLVENDLVTRVVLNDNDLGAFA